MTAPKTANVLPPAASSNGKLIVADIGSPVELIEQAKSQLFVIEAADAHRWLIQTRFTPDSYKNMHGHALVIAGSRGFTGAAALCGNAAMTAGAGLVTVATSVSVQPLVATQVMPEVMTTALVTTSSAENSTLAPCWQRSTNRNVIASAAKQSMGTRRVEAPYGLLRRCAPRNDGRG